MIIYNPNSSAHVPTGSLNAGHRGSEISVYTPPYIYSELQNIYCGTQFLIF